MADERQREPSVVAAVGHRALTHFFERSDDLLCVAGLDGELLNINAAWERVLGWDRATLLGLGFVDLLHPDDVASTRAAAAGLRDGVDVVDFENRYRRVDGSYVWLSWRATVDLDEALVLCVVRDVTESRRRQVHLATLEEVAHVGTWDLETDAGRLWWSPETHRIHGTDPARHVPALEDALACYPLAARQQLEPAVQRLEATGEPYDLVLPFVTIDGRARWVRTVGRAERRDGRTIRLYGTLEDVTEEHAEREALRHVRELVELSEEGIVETSIDGAVLYSNPRFATMLGTDPARLVGRSLGPYFSREAFARTRAWARQLQAGEVAVVRGELQLDRPDGVRVHVQVATTARRDGGVVASLTSVVTDVTEQVRQRLDLEHAHEQLEASESRLQLVLEATRDGWWDVDHEAGTAFYSARWWEMHGYGVDELTATSETWRAAIDPEALPSFERQLGAAVRHGQELVQVRSRGRRKDGSTFPIEVHVRLAYDGDGDLVRASGATSDISDLLAAERQQEAFISTVSHELRTPLTAIGGAIELLPRLTSLDERARDVHEMARRNTQRLGLLIDDLLQIEALRSDAAPLRPEPLRVDDVLARVIADAQPLTARAGVRLEAGAADPGCQVLADPQRLGQALLNYISNATKYAPPGSTVLVEHRTEDGKVRISVTDSGPGVPPAFADRAFSRFAQADPTDPRSRGGTGLGLAITRELVVRMGGCVGYDSVPGCTTFWLELPRAGR